MAKLSPQDVALIAAAYKVSDTQVMALPEASQQQALAAIRAAQAPPPPQRYVMGPLGLPIDGMAPSDMAPVVVLYGPPGVGKTHAIAEAFPNNLYVQSQGDILRFSEQFSRQYPDKLPYIPSHRVTLDELAVGRFYGGSVVRALNTLVGTFVQAAQANRCPYEGITFDEWSTFCKRVYAEFTLIERTAAAQGQRKFNIFNAMQLFRDWHQSMLSIGRLTGLNVCFVSHAQYPRYFEPGDPNAGKVKVQGGPRMPQGVAAELAELCQEASAVIEMTVESTVGALPAVPPLPGLPPTPGAPPTAPAVPPPPPPVTTLPIPGLQVTGAPASLTASATQEDREEAIQDKLAELHKVTDASAPRIYRTGLTADWFRKLRGLNVKVEERSRLGEHGLRQMLQQAGYPVGKFHQR